MLELSLLPSSPNEKIFEGFPGLGPVKLSGTIIIKNKRSQGIFSSPKPITIVRVEVEYFGIIKSIYMTEKCFSHKILMLDASHLSNPLIAKDEPISIFPDHCAELSYQWVVPQDVVASLPHSVEANKDILNFRQHGSVRYFCRVTCSSENSSDRKSKHLMKNILKSVSSFVGSSSTVSVTRPFRVIRYNRELMQKFLNQYQYDAEQSHKRLSWIPFNHATGTGGGWYFAQLGPDDTVSANRVHSFPVGSSRSSIHSLPASLNSSESDENDIPLQSSTPPTATTAMQRILSDITPLMLPRTALSIDNVLDPQTSGSRWSISLGRTNLVDSPRYSLSDEIFSSNPLPQLPELEEELILPSAALDTDNNAPAVERPRGPRITKEFSGTNRNAQYWVGINNTVLARGGQFKVYFRINATNEGGKKGKLKHVDINLVEKQEVSIKGKSAAVDVGVILSARTYEQNPGEFKKTSEVSLKVPIHYPKPYEVLEKENNSLRSNSPYNNSMEHLSWTNLTTTSRNAIQIQIGQSSMGTNASGKLGGGKIRISHVVTVKLVFSGAKSVDVSFPVTILHPSMEEVLRVAKDHSFLVWPEPLLNGDSMTPRHTARLLDAIGESILPAYRRSIPESPSSIGTFSRLPPPFSSPRNSRSSITIVNIKDYATA